jgi:hypothetical protein
LVWQWNLFFAPFNVGNRRWLRLRCESLKLAKF